MDDDNDAALTATTKVQINIKHILTALGVVIALAWAGTKYFYEQTHKDIDEVKDEVKELEKKLDEMDKRLDGHDVKISARDAKKEAAKRLAIKTGMDEEEANETVGFEEFGARSTRRGGGTRPFVDGAAGSTTRSADRRPDSSDRDNDGVPNGFDRCPDERETWNGYEDDDGCPDAIPRRGTADAQFRDSFVEACTEGTFLRRFHKECKACIAAMTDDECQDAIRHMEMSGGEGVRMAMSMEPQPEPEPNHDADGVPDEADAYPEQARYEPTTIGMAYIDEVPSRRTLRIVRRQKKKAERQIKRAKRHRKCKCRRDPHSCLVILREWPLDVASHLLSELQNTETGLRD